MNQLKTLLILLLLISVDTVCKAQDSEVGNWFVYLGNQTFSNKWNFWNEVQYRNYNFIGDLQQLVLRTGVGYNLTEHNNNILLGYAIINSHPYVPNSDEKTSFNEHRIFQQFITRQHFGRTFIMHRYRIEERFLPDDFRVRFRYLLLFNFPLNNKTMSDKTIYTSASNEIFLNAESPVFDQNRLYGGIGYVFNKNFRIEVGFMVQTFEKRNRSQFQILFSNNLPFTKN